MGRSHECDFPTEVQDRPILTAQNTEFTTAKGVDRAVSHALAAGQSLYSLDEQLLRSLRPDLILTQNLCEVCSIDLTTVRRLAASMDPRPDILSLNPHTFEGVLDDVLRVAAAAGLEKQGETALAALRERFFAAADYVNSYAQGPNVAFLEWTDPLYIGGHWTPQLVERAGARHPLNPTAAMPHAGAGAGGQMAHRVAAKSRRVTPEELVASRPDALIICPCGLSLDQVRREAALLSAQPWWPDLPAAQRGRVALVDGAQMFNRPGPRLVDAYEWLVGWVNGVEGLAPTGFPWEGWGG